MTSRSPDVDVLIVTALRLERRAVREHLSDISTFHGDRFVADVGYFDGRHGMRLTVAVVETGAGNVDAAVLTTAAEGEFRPSTILMVGVAGGLKDVRIGDVVASSKIYWVEGGKQAAHFFSRPEIAPVSPTLVQQARAVATDGTWVARVRSKTNSSESRTPTGVIAPIAAGEKVLADSKSDLAGLLRSRYSDAVAVAMEEFGVGRGGAAGERAKLLAVRGISDLIDHKAEADSAGSQPIAASHAAAFAFELLDLALVRNAGARVSPNALVSLGAHLYPDGPNQNGLWERAGGDPSRLEATGAGFAKWWRAARLLEQGGGGQITFQTILAVMASDFPHNENIDRLVSS